MDTVRSVDTVRAKGTVRVVVAKPLADEYVERIRRADPRAEVVIEPGLLRPMRWPSDHGGDPAFVRTPEQQARFEALIDSADVLYGIPDTEPASLARTVRANPRLRWVQTMAAGGGAQVRAANLTGEELRRVVFTTTAGVHAATLTEWALFGVLAGAKDLPILLDNKAHHHWPSARWTMRAICDMTIVVVGLGAIGRECVRRFAELGATVVGVNRSDKPVEHLSRLYLAGEIVQACRGADAIINALPGAVGTERLISREALQALNPGAIVASVGRGGCIDEPAMIELLGSGQLGFAALDVTAVEPLPPDSPLWAMPNVIISPHTAANSSQEDSRIADLFIENLVNFLNGGRLRNVVDTKLFY